jgi:hypothetical protein
LIEIQKWRRKPMRRMALSILLALILVSPVCAKEYRSSFGFTVDLPSHWLVLTKQEVKDNPDLFDFSREAPPNVNKNLLEHIRGQVESGRIEYYLNQKTSDLEFADNIVVTKAPGEIPRSRPGASELCDGLLAQVSRLLGRKINLYACEFRKVGGLNALYADFDGVVEGTRSLQYQIQKSPGVVIRITATLRNSNVESIRTEFKEIVSSMKMR